VCNRSKAVWGNKIYERCDPALLRASPEHTRHCRCTPVFLQKGDIPVFRVVSLFFLGCTRVTTTFPDQMTGSGLLRKDGSVQVIVSFARSSFSGSGTGILRHW
jgi:hypothetical protein